jgi:phage shock protein PspC (stress-responsive transcriptional regulator)
MMVVTLSMVERVIQQIGAPEDFAAESNNETKNINNKENRRMKQLRRSRSDRSIAGVCGGVAKYLGVDSTVLRIATFLLIFFGGMSLWVYIILWLLIPEE